MPKHIACFPRSITGNKSSVSLSAKSYDCPALDLPLPWDSQSTRTEAIHNQRRESRKASSRPGPLSDVEDDHPAA